MNKIHLLYLISYVIILSLQLASLLAENWVSLQSYTFSLTSCTSCTQLKSSWTLECLARDMCNSQDSACTTYTNLFNGIKIFIFLQVFSIFMCVLIIEKFLLVLTSTSFGAQTFIHIYSAFHILGQLIGLICLFEIGDIKFDQTLSGVKLAIASVVVSFVFGVLANVLLWLKRPLDTGPVFYESKIICGVNGKVFMLLGMGSGIIALAMIFSALIDDKWVNGKDFSGGLSRCYNCYQTEWMNWRCMKGYECNINENSETCNLFTRLATAESIYMPLQIVSVLFIMLSFQQTTSLIISYQYGWQYMSQAYVGIGFILHISGTIVYGGYSKVSLTGDCNTGICARQGYVLLIISNFFLAGYLLITIFIRPKLLISKFVSVVGVDKTISIMAKENSSFDIFSRHESKACFSENMGSSSYNENTRRESNFELLKHNTLNPNYIPSLNSP